jgi:hypothetical protein
MGRRSLLRILWSHNGFLNVGCEYAAWRVSLRMLAYMLGSGHGRESIADENVPVPAPPLMESSCFMTRRRQAPTGRHANPRFMGGPDDEAACTNRWGQERLRQRSSEVLKSPLFRDDGWAGG